MSSKPAPAPPDPIIELCGQSPVTSLVFSQPEEGQTCLKLFSGHQTGKIVEWNLKSRRAVRSQQSHADSVLWLSLAIGNLMSQGRDGVVRIWNHDQPSKLICIGEIQCAVLIFCNSIICKQEDIYYLAVPSDKTAQVNVHHLCKSVWDTTSAPANTDSTASCVKSLSESTFSHSLIPYPVEHYALCMKICSFHSSEHSPRLLVAYESGSLVLWDLVKGALLSEIKAHEESVMCMDVWANPDSGLVRCVTGSVDNTIRCWHIVENKLTLNSSVSVTNSGFSDIAIRGDGRIFTAGGWDNMGRVFSLNKLHPLAILTFHKGSIQSVTYAQDKTLATGSKDGYIAIWQLYMNQ